MQTPAKNDLNKKYSFFFLQLRKFVIGVIEMIIGIPPECKKIYRGKPSYTASCRCRSNEFRDMTCGKIFIHFEWRTFEKSVKSIS